MIKNIISAGKIIRIFTYVILTAMLTTLTACGNNGKEDDILSGELILEITDIQLSHPDDNLQLIDVTVAGNVSSGGWTQAVLVPVDYTTPPEDGIYNFSFYATPPEGAADTAITSIDVTYQVTNIPEEMTGIRIMAKTNELVVMLDTLEKPAPKPVSAVVNKITDVQLLKVEGSPGSFDIVVEANVLNEGWTNPVLIPFVYVTAPADGIYDFTLYATPPDDTSVMTTTPINIRQRLESVSDNFKGVRIHSDTNEQSALLPTDTPLPKPELTIIDTINDLQVIVLKGDPERMSIEAFGSVNSAGWSGSKLVPQEYSAPPEDGVYEFTWYALPPAEAGTTVITPIEVHHFTDSIPEDLAGIRIIADTNSMEYMSDTTLPAREPEIIYNITGLTLNSENGDGSQPGNGEASQLEITATGEVTSGGWAAAILVPTQYETPPADGIYDFTFKAVPPNGIATAVISRVEATYLLNPVPEDLVGVRVLSRTNNKVALLNPPDPAVVSKIILEITGVTIKPSTTAQGETDIHVTGLVSSGGWSKPLLIPYNYFAAPSDGIYDYSFYATPPDEGGTGAITPIEVTHTLGLVSTEMVGVRIHSTTNEIEGLFNTGSNQTTCDYVSGNSFQTLERYEGGAGPAGVDTRIYWVMTFSEDGEFIHYYSDAGSSGKYYCDETGFHLEDSQGSEYPEPGAGAYVDIENKRINVPAAIDVDRFYYLLEAVPLSL